MQNHPEHLFLISEIPSGIRLRNVILHQCNKALFSPASSPLKDLLLCAPASSDSFTPFVLDIAKKLSPLNSELHVAEKSVIDYNRRVVFNIDEYFDTTLDSVWLF